VTRIRGTSHEDFVNWWQYLSKFFIEREKFQEKFVKKSKAHVLCSLTFPPRPASWSNCQSLWLLIMRSRVRFSWLVGQAEQKMAKSKGRGRGGEASYQWSSYTWIYHKTTQKLHGVGFKKRAPRAIKDIRKFAMKQMGTTDVRVDTRLNKQVWWKGIRNVPFCVRVRLSRRRNDDEDSPNKLYNLVTYVPVASFKWLQKENVDAGQE